MENQNVQEIKTKKRSLKRYRLNVSCIERLESKLRLLETRIESVKSPNYSGMPRGGTPVTIEELLSDKIDLEKRIARLKSKGDSIKDQILEEIDSLEDPRYCEVLEAFLIECLDMEEIAEEMGYSVRWTYDLYSEAINELVLNDTTLKVQ